ncbi:MAG TPA: hypothetical protein VFM18_23375 [Methanosarcina sp.]|nr:hypothetical protein [Methanosarcina sp.]
MKCHTSPFVYVRVQSLPETMDKIVDDDSECTIGVRKERALAHASLDMHRALKFLLDENGNIEAAKQNAHWILNELKSAGVE